MVTIPAGSSYKERLDRVQAAAGQMGSFSVKSLGSRRETALIEFTLKLLDKNGRGLLNDFIPTITLSQASSRPKICSKLESRDTTKQFDRSIEGQISQIWPKIPTELLTKEKTDEWQGLTKNCQRSLTGKKLRETRKLKNKQSALIASSISDTRTILNNELNVKLDLISVTKELQSLGYKFNKSLSTL